MSIRNGLLALLARGPAHGYQLRADFESSTGSTWPLNIGQVYTTLDRLQRDGLVELLEGAGIEEGRVVYQLTPHGRQEVDEWFDTPLDRLVATRDELAIKLALALTTPGVDVAGTIDAQKGATMGALQDLIRLKRQATNDPAWLLIVDSMIFHAEAEVSWLDHCQARLASMPKVPGVRGNGTAPTTADVTEAAQQVSSSRL